MLPGWHAPGPRFQPMPGQRPSGSGDIDRQSRGSLAENFPVARPTSERFRCETKVAGTFEQVWFSQAVQPNDDEHVAGADLAHQPGHGRAGARNAGSVLLDDHVAAGRPGACSSVDMRA